MNLTSMLQDTSLTNLQWLNDPKTYLPQDKDTNQKDDLAIEWGRGDASVVDRPHTTIKTEMKVKNSIKDVETLADYAQVLMHQGITREEVMNQVKFRFPSETIDAAAPLLANVFKMEGIVGCVAIDVRGAKNPSKVVQAAMKSPFKRHIAYVIMEPEEAARNAFVKHRRVPSESTSTGSIDGFFAGVERVASSEMFYEPLNLPVIVGGADLDPSYYDATLIDLVNTSGLTEDEARKLYAAEGDAWKKLATAFRVAMRRHAQKAEGSEKATNKASEYQMKSSSLDVQIGRRAKRNLSVFMVTGPVSKVDLDAKAAVMEDLEVDGTIPGQPNIDIVPQHLSDLDVEPETVMDEEFTGIDEFELDPVAERVADLSIDRFGEIEI